MSGSLSTEDVVALLDHRSESTVAANFIRLRNEHGLEALVPRCVAAFPRIRHSPGRVHVLYWLVRFARRRGEVVDLAETALSDASRMVRHHACAVLAYSGRRSSLPALRQALLHRSKPTQEDARAAIAAIEHGNHHLFVDRKGTGKDFWVVNPEDDPPTPAARRVDGAWWNKKDHGQALLGWRSPGATIAVMLDEDLVKALTGALEADETIVLAYVFGSVGRGDATEGSDVDVAVLSTAELGLDGVCRLGEALGRAIGSRRTVDVVDLRSASPALSAEVVREGIRVVERDPEARFDFEMGVIRRFEDTRALRRLQQELLREGSRGRP